MIKNNFNKHCKGIKDVSASFSNCELFSKEETYVSNKGN